MRSYPRNLDGIRIRLGRDRAAASIHIGVLEISNHRERNIFQARGVTPTNSENTRVK
jgi:hypothetical protein